MSEAKVKVNEVKKETYNKNVINKADKLPKIG